MHTHTQRTHTQRTHTQRTHTQCLSHAHARCFRSIALGCGVLQCVVVCCNVRLEWVRRLLNASDHRQSHVLGLLIVTILYRPALDSTYGWTRLYIWLQGVGCSRSLRPTSKTTLQSSRCTLHRQSHLLPLSITLYMGALDSIYGCTWLSMWVHLTPYMDALDSRNGFAWLRRCAGRWHPQCYRVNVTHCVLLADDLCLHLTLYMDALDSLYGLLLTLYMAALDFLYDCAWLGICAGCCRGVQGHQSKSSTFDHLVNLIWHISRLCLCVRVCVCECLCARVRVRVCVRALSYTQVCG